MPQLQAPPGVVAESVAGVGVKELRLLVRTPRVLEVEQRVEVPLAGAALELRDERGAVRREGVALGEFEVRELREVVGAADCGCERQRPCGHRLFHHIAAFLFIRSPHTAAIIPETRTARQSRGRCAAAAGRFFARAFAAARPAASPIWLQFTITRHAPCASRSQSRMRPGARTFSAPFGTIER